MLKREEMFIVKYLINCSLSGLMPIIEGKAYKDSAIYTDYFNSYDGLVDYVYKKHYRVKHSKNEFAKGNDHINGIEDLGLCKVILSKFRGINKNKFHFHLK